MSTSSGRISRRDFVANVTKGALGATLTSIAMAGVPKRALADSGTLRIATSGGSYEAAMKKAYFGPYQQLHPDLTLQLTTPDDSSRIKAMVEAGNVTIDLSTTGDFFGFDADAQWLEPIDYNVIDANSLLPGAAMKYRVGNDIENTIITYRKDKAPSGVGPANFTEFFDVGRFPGKRAVWKWAAGGIFEAALIADGVPVSGLYPIDVDRALKKLTSIKDSLIWWESGAQGQQLLTSGEAPYGILWGSRAFPAMDTAPVAVSWDQWLSGGGWWVVPKGASNRDAAFQALKYFLSKDPQIAFTKYLPYGPVNKEAGQHPDPRYEGNLPTDHWANRVAIDNLWWLKNESGADTKFQQWLLT